MLRSKKIMMLADVAIVRMGMHASDESFTKFLDSQEDELDGF